MCVCVCLERNDARSPAPTTEKCVKWLCVLALPPVVLDLCVFQGRQEKTKVLN